MTFPKYEADRPGLVWIAALLVAGLGTWVMYNAMPGINWGIWTAAASIGLLLIASSREQLDPSLVGVVGAATLIAFASTVTSNEFINALSVLSVMLLLAVAMLLAVRPRWERLSAFFVVTAPFVAGFNALVQSFTRVVGLTHLLRSARARAIVRGIVITIPIVVIFALLLAGADPIFANVRDNIADFIKNWSFIPRLIFFVVLLTVVLGAYSFAAQNTAADVPDAADTEAASRWIGATERLILISSVTALFWLFIAVQLSYLFGNAPSVKGSGITFADYAHKGFAELSIVATFSAILILVTERYGNTDGREKTYRYLSVAIILAVIIMLGSAFRRLVLYEDAYGFTVPRLYAQAYMIVLAIALVALTAGVLTTLDTRRLFRQVFAAATLAFVILAFWNHEAWIAKANIDRFAATGKLDTKYLATELSPDAVPTVVDHLRQLPDSQRTDLQYWLNQRYKGRPVLRDDQWYEWNYRRERARESLATIGIRAPEPRALVMEPVVVSARD